MSDIVTMGQSMTYGRCIIVVYGNRIDGQVVSIVDDAVRTVEIRGSEVRR